MGGPGVSILLSRSPSVDDTKVIAETIVAVCGESTAWDEMHVLNTLKIGGTFSAQRRDESRPFGICRSSVDEYERDAAVAISSHFGFDARSQVEIYAFCNAKIDHQILGELTLHLATQLAPSVISFGGNLGAYASIGGRLLSVAYETAWGTTAYSSYGDRHFLRAWLRHPSFFLIK